MAYLLSFSNFSGHSDFSIQILVDELQYFTWSHDLRWNDPIHLSHVVANGFQSGSKLRSSSPRLRSISRQTTCDSQGLYGSITMFWSTMDRMLAWRFSGAERFATPQSSGTSEEGRVSVDWGTQGTWVKNPCRILKAYSDMLTYFYFNLLVCLVKLFKKTLLQNCQYCLNRVALVPCSDALHLKYNSNPMLLALQALSQSLPRNLKREYNLLFEYCLWYLPIYYTIGTPHCWSTYKNISYNYE